MGTFKDMFTAIAKTAGYICPQAKSTLKKIEKVSKDNVYGLYKLESKLTGKQKLRRQFSGRAEDIKGSVLRVSPEDDSYTIFYIDLCQEAGEYDVVSFGKKAEKMPNRFLANIAKANKKWEEKQKAKES